MRTGLDYSAMRQGYAPSPRPRIIVPKTPPTQWLPGSVAVRFCGSVALWLCMRRLRFENQRMHEFKSYKLIDREAQSLRGRVVGFRPWRCVSEAFDSLLRKLRSVAQITRFRSKIRFRGVMRHS